MLRPCCLPILIGSLPLTSHSEAAQLILKYTPDIPLWAQLPKNPGEGMIRQFLTGFPCLEENSQRFWIDTSRADFADEMTSFYTEYMEAEANNDTLNISRFRLTDDTAPGFTAFIEVLKSATTEPETLKGQVTGPVTTGIGTRDSQGNSIFYDDNLRDMLIKHLAMKGRWQALQLSRLTDNKPIIFIDEPGMVSFGSSAFTGISREMVVEAVTEVITGIQQGNGLAGVHICANGDWGPALESGADIISFDAYSYFENFILYKEQLINFLQSGGILAWGIIPTGDPLLVAEETADNLFAKWRHQLDTLTGFGISEHKLLEQTFITPACGTGSLPLELAYKVLTMTSDVSFQCRNYLKARTETNSIEKE